MITREAAVRRLDDIAREVEALRREIEQGWPDTRDADPTASFLAKCGGWQDSRSPEEIIAEIYAARTTSERGAAAFAGG